MVHALETSRLSPRQLTLEITESVLVSDVEAMSVRLRELKGLGVLLASTTSAPATRRSATCAASRSILKIDKAFVDGIGRGREDTALAHAIVKLSHTLQLHTVAEGIEQPEQAAHLVTLGCQEGQGFWFARPLDNGAMTELLATSLADGGFYLPVTRSAEAAVAT